MSALPSLTWRLSLLGGKGDLARNTKFVHSYLLKRSQKCSASSFLGTLLSSPTGQCLFQQCLEQDGRTWPPDSPSPNLASLTSLTLVSLGTHCEVAMTTFSFFLLPLLLIPPKHSFIKNLLCAMCHAVSHLILVPMWGEMISSLPFSGAITKVWRSQTFVQCHLLTSRVKTSIWGIFSSWCHLYSWLPGFPGFFIEF